MKRASASLALLIVLAGVAAAQPMIDPREMSGIPRPDPQVPARLLTVRVLHGEFAKPADVGHPVHLVQIMPDGSVSKRTELVRAEPDPAGGGKVNSGRVEFGDLEPSGRVAYHALTLLDGDRLSSQPIDLPPMIGVKSMLVGRKLDAAGAPVGPAIDDAAGEGVRPTPAGQVVVLVRGANELPGVELVEIPAVGAKETVRTEKAKELPIGELASTFDGVAGGPDKVYLARIRKGARTFVSAPFMMTETAGVTTVVFALDQILFGFHMGGELDDEFMRFEARYSIGNLSGVPYDPGERGLLMPLAKGALGPRLAEDELQSIVRIVPDGATWSAIVPPGQRDLTLQWSLPVVDGAVDLELPVPLGAYQSQIFLEKLPGTVLTPPAGTKTQVKRLDGGREFDVVSPIQVQPGGTVKLRVTGLPERPMSDVAVRAGVSLIVLAFLLLAAWLAIRPPPRAPVQKMAQARKDELRARREALYEELVRVERQRADGSLDDDAAGRARDAAVAKLTAVLHELDRLEAQRP